MKNSTFKPHAPTWANACVGDNGSPEIRDYAEGFGLAANLLIESVLTSRGRNSPDILVYPICFSMRHAVELHLKSTVEYLRRLSAHREQLRDFPAATSHDLMLIWEYVKEHSVAIDRRYAPVTSSLDDLITDIASVDSNGQVFRYPFDIDNKKHLVEIGVISVSLLKTRFKELQRLLKHLDSLNSRLVTEYALGSFTRKMSRYDLFLLASELPGRQHWGEHDFDKVRSRLREKYLLSSGEFSRALTIIQSNYEMAQLIDAPIPIPGIDRVSLQTFFDQWIKVHGTAHMTDDIPDVRVIASIDLKEMEVSQKMYAECCAALAAKLSNESFASLKALYYFSIDTTYSENFETSRAMSLEMANRSDTIQHSEALMHLLDKANAFEAIVNSLQILGQEALVDFVLQTYGLAKFRDRLLEPSSNHTWRELDFADDFGLLAVSR